MSVAERPSFADASAWPPAAVLWDMDGTLIDTEPFWIRAEHRLVATFGNGAWTDEHGHQMVGLDLRASARYIQRNGDVDLGVDEIVERLIDGVLDEVRVHCPWRPGAVELLAELRAAGIPCALVTMSWMRLAQAVVEQLPPGSFAEIIAGDEVSRGKPEPDAYLLGAERLGVNPAWCVALEDSPTGVASAMAAGCRTVAIPNVLTIADQPGLTIVDSLVDIDVPWLEELFSDRSSGDERRDPILDDRRRDRPAVFSRRQLLGGVAAAASVGAVGWWLLRDGTSLPPPPDIPLHAWVPYWQLERAIDAFSANSTMLTTVSPFWFEVNDTNGPETISTNEHASTERTERFIELARSRRVPVVPSIIDLTTAGTMAAVIADPTRRQAHIEAIVRFAADGKFDGVDLDYEKFALGDGRSTWTATRSNYVTFVRMLAERLHADGRTLSVTVMPILDDGSPSDSGYWVFDHRQLAAAADQLRVMAYDHAYDRPGAIAPLDWVRRLSRASRRAVADSRKVLLGVPLYGYNWLTSTSGECPADAAGSRTSVTQGNINGLISRRSAQPSIDSEGEMTFTYEAPFPEEQPACRQTREVHLVSAQGSLQRIDVARTTLLGGASLWALGFDSDETWTELYKLARTSSTSPTTGSTTTGSTTAG